MKKTAFWFLLHLFCCHSQAQEQSRRAPLSRLSYTISLDFQGFSLPFSTLRTYWQNKGISVGAAYSWTRKGHWQQVVKAGSFFNRYHGRTNYVSTSLQYNPLHGRTLSTGISLGAGYQLTGFGKGGWQQEADGSWKSRPNKQGLLFLPASLNLCVKAAEGSNIIFSPSLSYGVNLLWKPNATVPLLPQTLVSIGSTIQFK